MRVIQLNDGWGTGGADRVHLALGRELQSLGHEVICAARPPFYQYLGLPAPTKFHWHIQRFRSLPLRELLEFNRRAADADIVLTHESGSRHFALMAKLLGLKPRVWFMRHCISGTTRFGGVQLHRLLVDHHIAVSNVIRDGLLASGYPANCVSRIYGAVDLAPFHSPAPGVVAGLRSQWLDHLDPGTTVIGIVARMGISQGWYPALKEGKGYDILFQALSRVSFPYRVVIFGPEGPGCSATLRQMATHYGANPANLCMAGFVQNMAGSYQLMDINVLPSRREGLGLALIEGMASGVVGVGSRCGGIVEIIEHEQTGLLFDEGDYRGLATCLERLAADQKLRETLARRGQAHALQHFSAAAMARSFCELATAKKIRSGAR